MNIETIDISSQKYATILGVGLNSTSVDSLLRKIAVDINNSRKFYIVTPNPEIVMAAQKDRGLMTALNAAEVAIPDGVGLAAANKYLQMPSSKNPALNFILSFIQGLMVGVTVVSNRHFIEEGLPIIKGRDLFIEVVKIANRHRWKVYFLGGEGSEAENAKKELEKNFKHVKIRTNAGPLLSIDGTPKTSTDMLVEKEVVNDINLFSPDILFVGISHPRQEKWLYRWYKKLNIKGAMAVGGTYKFITGDYSYPPKRISGIGLDWLWRLFTGGQKIGRIYTAVIQFPWKVFTTKLLQK